MNGKEENSKIAAIIQARLGSTRLPGKILKEVSGMPILWHVVNRLSYSKLIDEIIIATTDLAEDDRVQDFCERNNILFYRGSSEDVLSRYYETASKFEAGAIIRITSDCPVIDPVIIDRMLEYYLKENLSGSMDYLNNVMPRTFPRGLDTEIFSFRALALAHHDAKQFYEREHVTPYIYNHPEIFTLKSFTSEKDHSAYRWTVDTQEDFLLIEKIYTSLYKKNNLFLLPDILKLFEEQPQLIKINQSVKQKNLGE